MYIPQKQIINVKKYLMPQKAIIIYGPRRCGKTTLLQQLIKNINEKYLFINGEDITTQNYLASQSIQKLKNFVGKNRLLIIDEAQCIKNIGINLKLMLDNIKGLKIIASGSSAFDLAHQLGEPLTGRKYTFILYPLSQLELNNIESSIETIARLEMRLIYGSYPEVILCQDIKQNEFYLKEIISSYLYKDILELEGIKYSDKLVRLLQCLAFQIGKEVSCTELGTHLGMSKNTVDRYLDLLQKSFVLYRLNGFSRNLRKEVTKNSKYYFYDLGVRNALINNFNPLEMRNDIGMLWENYIIIEILKKQEYQQDFSNNYFWRTYDKKEIDFVVEKNANLFAYEIKWKNLKYKVPKDWKNVYKNSKFQLITKNNYLKFIA